MADPDYIWHSILFGPDGRLEVSFTRKTDITEIGTTTTTHQVVPGLMDSEMEDLYDALEQVIIRYETLKRNPDQVIAPRNR